MYMRHRITQILAMFSLLSSLVHVTVLHVTDLMLLCTVLMTLLRDTPHHTTCYLYLPEHNSVC